MISKYTEYNRIVSQIPSQHRTQEVMDAEERVFHYFNRMSELGRVHTETYNVLVHEVAQSVARSINNSENVSDEVKSIPSQICSTLLKE